jgi:hypothetical protein
MNLRTAHLRLFALSLIAGVVGACAPAAPPKAETAPLLDVRASVASLKIPACDQYVAVIEDECFGSPSHTFPAGLVGLVEYRVDGWRRDALEPGGRARVATSCTSAREAMQTFHCEAR